MDCQQIVPRSASTRVLPAFFGPSLFFSPHALLDSKMQCYVVNSLLPGVVNVCCDCEVLCPRTSDLIHVAKELGDAS